MQDACINFDMGGSGRRGHSKKLKKADVIERKVNCIVVMPVDKVLTLLAPSVISAALRLR